MFNSQRTWVWCRLQVTIVDNEGKEKGKGEWQFPLWSLALKDVVSPSPPQSATQGKLTKPNVAQHLTASAVHQEAAGGQGGG